MIGSRIVHFHPRNVPTASFALGDRVRVENMLAEHVLLFFGKALFTFFYYLFRNTKGGTFQMLKIDNFLKEVREPAVILDSISGPHWSSPLTHLHLAP
jgi:hypothetical protein